MGSAARNSALVLASCCLAPGFFSNPARVASLTQAGESQWERADIGVVWSDNFDRASLGANWVITNNADASIVNNELMFNQPDVHYEKQVFYLPWLTCSDHWTLRWSQRFDVLNATSYGVGVGILNFQAAGGNDRGYNAVILGAGTDFGKMLIQRWDGSGHTDVSSGPPLALAAGDMVDCSLSRSGWTMSATASNRANGQVSTTSFEFSDFATPRLEAPTISRICFYLLQGTVYVDNLSFSIDRRKPARFVVIGDSISEGYDATDYANAYVNVVRSNFTQAVCNDSGSYNTTDNSVSLLPEILAHQPGTAILMIGGNDLLFSYPTAQWQNNYSNLVAQLQANGVKVKHCWPTPRTPVDLRPLKNWISAHYPAQDIIDVWTPLVTSNYKLKPAYDNYDNDGVHPNDAGHLVIGQIIRTNLP
jgi:lysophospholipase L1-like esterase